MKEMIEEYGGVILACAMGIVLLGAVAALLGTGGGMHQLAEAFAEGAGAVCVR